MSDKINRLLNSERIRSQNLQVELTRRAGDVLMMRQRAEQAEARAEKLAEALRDIIAPSGKSLTHQIEAEMRETARAALRDYEAVDSIHTPEIS